MNTEKFRIIKRKLFNDEVMYVAQYNRYTIRGEQQPDPLFAGESWLDVNAHVDFGVSEPTFGNQKTIEGARAQIKRLKELTFKDDEVVEYLD